MLFAGERGLPYGKDRADGMGAYSGVLWKD